MSVHALHILKKTKLQAFFYLRLAKLDTPGSRVFLLFTLANNKTRKKVSVRPSAEFGKVTRKLWKIFLEFLQESKVIPEFWFVRSLQVTTGIRTRAGRSSLIPEVSLQVKNMRNHIFCQKINPLKIELQPKLWKSRTLIFGEFQFYISRRHYQ